MKWPEEKVNQLKELAFAGVSNPKIAEKLGVDVSDVYAKRSQLGITIDKVRAVKVAEVTQDSEKTTLKNLDGERLARYREEDERRNLIQLLEPLIMRADPSVKAVVLRDQGQLVRIEYKNDTRRYVGIGGDSLLAIIYDIARVCMK